MANEIGFAGCTRKAPLAPTVLKRQAKWLEDKRAQQSKPTTRGVLMMTVPILKIGKNLITSIQIALTDRQAQEFENEVLEEVARTGAFGIIIDITAMEVVDSYMARILSETAMNVRLMGAHAVIVGMRPEVAITLVQMGRGLMGIPTALNLEQGLAKLEKISSGKGAGHED